MVMHAAQGSIPAVNPPFTYCDTVFCRSQHTWSDPAGLVTSLLFFANTGGLQRWRQTRRNDGFRSWSRVSRPGLKIKIWINASFVETGTASWAELLCSEKLLQASDRILSAYSEPAELRLLSGQKLLFWNTRIISGSNCEAPLAFVFCRQRHTGLKTGGTDGSAVAHADKPSLIKPWNVSFWWSVWVLNPAAPLSQ